MSEMYSLIRNGHFMASFFTFFTHINSSSLEPSQLEALWEPNCIFCWSRMVGQCHQPQSSLFQTIVIRIRQRPLLENPAKCLLLLLVLVATLSWFRFEKKYRNILNTYFQTTLERPKSYNFWMFLKNLIITDYNTDYWKSFRNHHNYLLWKIWKLKILGLKKLEICGTFLFIMAHCGL